MCISTGNFDSIFFLWITLFLNFEIWRKWKILLKQLVSTTPLKPLNRALKCVDMHFYRKCWFDPFEEKFISPFSSNFDFQKWALFPEKKLNQNVLWICTCIHYVVHYYKVSENSVERFQRSCADKLFRIQ